VTQQPITSAATAVIDGAAGMLEASKLLAANPRDPATYQAYSSQSRALSGAIKSIVSNIRLTFYCKNVLLTVLPICFGLSVVISSFPPKL